MSSEAWSKSKKRSEEGGAGGLFLRLPGDGDKAKGIFVGGPEPVETKFVDGKGVPLTDEDRAKGVKVNPRFKINFWNLGEDKMQIFEMSNATFKELIISEEKYDFTKKSFEVIRRGTQMETTYRILLDDDITDEVKKKIAGCKLYDLTKANHDDDEATDMESHGKKGKKANGATNGTANGKKNEAASAPAPSANETIARDDAMKILERIKRFPSPQATWASISSTLTDTPSVGVIKKADHIKVLAALDLLERPAEQDEFAL